MSPQADYVVSNGTGASVRSDINGQLAAIVSNNSGATEPATMYAYQWWPDTTTGLLKIRNSANNAWVTVGTLASANLGLAALASPTFTGTVTAPTFTASTAVNIPLGSAGSPTLFFTGDSNTGLFSPGADAIALATAGTNRLHITSGGLVGIGATTPNKLCELRSTDAATTLRISNRYAANSGAAVIDFETLYGGVDGAYGYAEIGAVRDGTSTNYMYFKTSGSERARIDSSGRLLVGTSTAQGGDLLQSFGSLGLTGTAGSNQINFYGTAIEFVNRNGTARAMQFYVGASGGTPVASLSSAGVWTNASDVKNKENIEDIGYGLEIVKKLIPRQFNVKSNGKHAIGFIAQEVQPLIPELISETFVEATQETHLGLDYGSLTAVLTKALQEAIGRIEILEAEVAALKAQ